jgi:hypothetical protein
LKKLKTKTTKTKIRRLARDLRATSLRADRARSVRHQRATPLRADRDHEQSDPLESALAAAALLAEPYPEEAESIDNVIRFVRDYRHGRLAEVRLSDVLLALSIILGATDHDLTPEERDMLRALELALSPLTRTDSVCVSSAAALLPLSIAAAGRAPAHRHHASLHLNASPYARLAA